MRLPRWVSLLFILFLTPFLLLSALPAAEDPPEETPIASGVQRELVTVVLVDVVVTDRKGRPIGDLRPEEFSLKVDGTPHPIDSVELQLGGASAEELVAVGAKKGKGEEESPDSMTTVPVSRKLILLFDGLNSERGIRDRVVEDARKFVDKSLAPGDQTMVVGLKRHLKVYQKFTDDPAELLAALDRVEQDEEIRRMAVTTVRTNLDYLEQIGEVIGDYMGPSCAQCESLAKVFAQEDDQRTKLTLSSLRSLIAYLHPLRGRKDLVFLTEGVVANAGDLYGLPLERGLEPEFLQLSREAAAAQVVLNTVNTLGLTKADPVEEYLERKLSDSIATFALNTGGQAIRGSNGFEQALKKVEEGSRVSYSIAFTPDGLPDGKFHSIKLAVSRKKTRIRAKQGFIRMSPEQLGEREILSAYVTPELFNIIPVQLDVRSYLGADNLPMVEIAIGVPEENLLFLPQQGVSVAELEAGFVVTRRMGEIVDQFNRGLRTRLRPDQFLAPGDLALIAHRPFPPGEYEVVAVVRDLGTGNIGAVRAPLQVPNLSTGAMAMSSLFLGIVDKSNKILSLDQTDFPGANLTVPVSHKSYLRTQQPICSYYLYRPRQSEDEGEARVRIQGSIYQGGELVQQLPSATHRLGAEQATDRVPIEMRLSLSELPPGEYRLVVQAWDEVVGTEVVREVEFRVR